MGILGNGYAVNVKLSHSFLFAVWGTTLLFLLPATGKHTVETPHDMVHMRVHVLEESMWSIYDRILSALVPSTQGRMEVKNSGTLG